MHDSILFLTLRVFSGTGGIEKMCRIMGKAFFEKTKISFCRVTILSSHDSNSEADGNPYFPAESFRGFSGSKWIFLLTAVRKGIGKSHVVLSHINLMPAGWLIKLFSPRTRILLMAHGIEIWELPLGIKKYLMGACDRILCVSEFTKEKIMAIPGLPGHRCEVLNNCLDPFLPEGSSESGSANILRQFGFTPEDTVLFTLTRMSSSERYKGYDKVIEALALIRHEFPGLRYLIAGKYDREEEVLIQELIQKNELEGKVKMAGFVEDDILPELFRSADIYIMPSYREGFGIVFIEAMYYGLPVIAGDTDGSADALAGGEMGLLTNPHDTAAIGAAIRRMLRDKAAWMPSREKVSEKFGYESYRDRFFKQLQFN